MRVLSHALIATKVFLSSNPKITIGVMLPDLEIATQLGTFEPMEIHEGGRELKDYLQIHAPEDLAFALGMMSHGVETFGVDYYNDRNWQNAGIGWAHLKKKPLVGEVIQLYQVSPEIGSTLAHNFIELGVDFLISQHYPSIVRLVKSAIKGRDEKTITRHLSACFAKDEEKVEQSLELFFAHYQDTDVSTFKGQALIWSRISEVLVKRPVAVNNVQKLMEKAVILVKDDWKEVIKEIEIKVAENEWVKEGKIAKEKET